MLGPSCPEQSGHAGLRPEQPHWGNRVCTKLSRWDVKWFPLMSAWPCICSHMVLFSSAWKTSCKLCVIMLHCRNIHLSSASQLLCYPVTKHSNVLLIWCYCCVFVDRVQGLPSISALKFNGSLTMAVGTSTGQVSQMLCFGLIIQTSVTHNIFMMAVCSRWTWSTASFSTSSLFIVVNYQLPTWRENSVPSSWD